MPDDVNLNDEQGETPDPQGAAKGGESGEAQGKTFTEAEVNAMMAARLAKHERSLKSTWEKEQAEARRKADQSAEERAKEAETRAQKVSEEAEAKVREAERRISLVGKVRDVDYAIFKLGQAGDKFVSADGQVDVDAFLKANPDQAFARPGPAPTPGAGRPTGGKVDMNALIRDQINRAR